MLINQSSVSTWDDRIFSTAEILAAASLDNGQDRAFDQCLDGVSLTRQTLLSPSTRVSLKQSLTLLLTYEKALRDPYLGLRIGQALRLAAYGMVGFALLSCQKLEEAIKVANGFSPLMNLKYPLRLEKRDRVASIALVEHFTLLGAERSFAILLEMSKMLTLLKDVLGQPFKVLQINFTLPGDECDAMKISAILGAPVNLNQVENSLTFDADYLDQTLPQANNLTHATCFNLCEEQLQAVNQRYELCYQVHTILLNAKTHIPSLSEIANMLHTSPRTLRRRLEANHTSYNRLLEEVRKKQAIRYLLDTTLSTEAISEKLSYSDAANFRHAFKRWTGSAPREFRSLNKNADSLITMRF